jgi:hypothetical protein
VLKMSVKFQLSRQRTEEFIRNHSHLPTHVSYYKGALKAMETPHTLCSVSHWGSLSGNLSNRCSTHTISKRASPMNSSRW